MPRHAGKIIQSRNRFPGPPTVMLSTTGIGLRKVLHLCYTCRHFKPRDPVENCRMAEEATAKSRENATMDIRIMCPQFEDMDEGNGNVQGAAA
jgi:hypothetical protein